MENENNEVKAEGTEEAKTEVGTEENTGVAPADPVAEETANDAKPEEVGFAQ